MKSVVLFVVAILLVATVAVDNPGQFSSPTRRHQPTWRSISDNPFLRFMQSSRNKLHPESSEEDQRPLSSLDDHHVQFSPDRRLLYSGQFELDQSPQLSRKDQIPQFSQEDNRSQPSRDDQRHKSSQDDKPDHRHSTVQCTSSKAFSPHNIVEVSTLRHYNLSQLSFAAKERLKSVGSVDELLQIPGFSQLREKQLVEEHLRQEEESGGKVMASLVDRSSRQPRLMRHRQKKRKSISEVVTYAQQAKCDVERRTEYLEPPPGSRYIPSCVRVAKCSGCCRPGRNCTPVVTKTVNLTVIKLWDNQVTSEDVVVEVEEELECECKCAVLASQCDPNTEEYDEDNCQCVCKSSLKEKQAKCQESPQHHWHPSECRCLCIGQLSRECSSGYTFSEETCRCE